MKINYTTGCTCDSLTIDSKDLVYCEQYGDFIYSYTLEI